LIKPLIWLLAIVFALNVPPIVLGEAGLAHALLGHGTEALNALWQAESGGCVRTYRCIERNRVLHVVGNGAFRYGIWTTLGGAFLTAYHAPALYWELRAAGYELMRIVGECR